MSTCTPAHTCTPAAPQFQEVRDFNRQLVPAGVPHNLVPEEEEEEAPEGEEAESNASTVEQAATETQSSDESEWLPEFLSLHRRRFVGLLHTTEVRWFAAHAAQIPHAISLPPTLSNVRVSGVLMLRIVRSLPHVPHVRCLCRSDRCPRARQWGQRAVGQRERVTISGPFGKHGGPSREDQVH